MESFSYTELDELLEDASALLTSFQKENLIEKLENDILSDINWAHQNDPASESTDDITIRKTLIAVAYYRFTNILWYEVGSYNIAKKLYEKAKKETNIDLHPQAKIGVPFAIDHGSSTIVGQTTSIGEFCLLLNNVTLGSIKVGAEATLSLRGSKRQPTIGSHVIICSHVRVLGPVEIGDNCFIGSYVLITNDIPANSEVTCIAQLQIWRKDSKSKKQPPVIRSVYPVYFTPYSGDCIYITGYGFNASTKIDFIRFENSSEICISPREFEIQSDNAIIANIPKDQLLFGTWMIRLQNNDTQAYTLTNAFTYQPD